MLAEFVLLALTTPSLPAAAALTSVQEGAPAEEPQVVDGKVEINGIEFQVGPCTGDLGQKAELAVPEGLLFTGRKGTVEFLTLTQNPSGEGEVGAILDRVGGWFVIFTHEDSGHVKDDEKDDLDADALLEAMQEGTQYGNEERKRRGWEEIELVGWHKPPFYDPKTNNLTWATIVRSKSGQSVNWTTKLLGRTSTMTVDLVVDPAQVDAAVPKLEGLITGFGYKEGHRYAEFRSGDKVAEYGLTALVAGGAGVVAFKTGILAKFWKFIVGGIVAVGLAIKKLFGFAKKEPGEASGA